MLTDGENALRKSTYPDATPLFSVHLHFTSVLYFAINVLQAIWTKCTLTVIYSGEVKSNRPFADAETEVVSRNERRS